MIMGQMVAMTMGLTRAMSSKRKEMISSLKSKTPSTVQYPSFTMILAEFTSIIVEGDDLKADNPREAIELFEKVVDLETKLGEQVKW